VAASWWSKGEGGITVAVRVAPGARRSEVVDASGDRLRVRVAAPAHEGKANAEIQRFLAGVFEVRASRVSLVRGERSRDKSVWIAGIAEPPAGLLGTDPGPVVAS
jgi:uncharacterized protein (TIGR00251 family)